MNIGWSDNQNYTANVSWCSMNFARLWFTIMWLQLSFINITKFHANQAGFSYVFCSLNVAMALRIIPAISERTKRCVLSKTCIINFWDWGSEVFMLMMNCAIGMSLHRDRSNSKMKIETNRKRKRTMFSSSDDNYNIYHEMYNPLMAFTMIILQHVHTIKTI